MMKHTLLSNLHPLLFVVALLQVNIPAQAENVAGTLEGIHIHRTGSSPSTQNAAKEILKGLQGQCESLQKVCVMLPAGASSKEQATCALVHGGFSFKGNLEELATFETDEYFATEMQMAAKQVKQSVLFPKSVCEVEVAEEKTIDIWHYRLADYTHYKLKSNRRKADTWLRTEHKRLTSEVGALLAGVFPIVKESKVSAVLGHKIYAGHKCEIREISGPVSSTSCLMPTDSTFPGYVKLAGTLVVGENTLMDEKATAVAVKTLLPRALFFPPEGEKIINSQEQAKSADNPTQKWCEKQKIKTGVNPCDDDPEDEK